MESSQHLTLSTAQRTLFAAAWLVLLGLALWLPTFWSGMSMDVAVYWEAGKRMREGGAALYAPTADPANEVGIYIYPPFFAAMIAPLTWLPRPVGYAVWAGLQWVIAAAAFFFVGRAAGDTEGAPVKHRGLVSEALVHSSTQLPLLVATFGAIWINFLEGQVNLLLVVLLAAGVWQLERGRTWRGGLLLAAAAHLKVIPIVLLAVLAAQRRFKACAAMLAGCAAVWLLPLVWTLPAEGVHGFERNVTLTREYIAGVVSPRVESQTAEAVGGARAPNNSLNAVVNRWFGDNHELSLHSHGTSPVAFALPAWLVKWAGFGGGALLFVAALVFAARCRGDRRARVAAAGLALLAAALGNLLFWPHHLSLLLIALGPLAMTKEYRRRTWVVAISVAVLCFLPLLDPHYGTWLLIWGLPTACIMAAFAVVWWTFRMRAPILPAHEKTNPRASTA